MDLVKDWGGFESLIATLLETGDVSVERNITITGKSGAPRQIDVLVTHTQGLFKHTIIVECKYWNTSIKRTHIDSMAAAIEDVNASKGVFFTTKGFQAGAKKMASSKGIELFRVRELLEKEWGRPGRKIDFYLQIFTRAIGNFQMPGAVAAIIAKEKPSDLSSIKIAFIAGRDGFESQTTIIEDGKKESRTLESLLDRGSMEVLQRVTSKNVTFNKGTDCVVHMMAHLNLVFPKPIGIPMHHGGVVLCPEIRCDVGIRVDQSHLKFDRGNRFIFALAVENCVTGVIYAASRNKGSVVTNLTRIVSNGAPDSEDTFQNGAIMKVVLKSFFEFKELDRLTEIPCPSGLEIKQ